MNDIKLKTSGEGFVLEEDCKIVVWYKGARKSYTVPAGFYTDFTSTPRWALSFIGKPTRPDFRKASLLHDYLLVSKKEPYNVAHSIFYKILKEEGVSLTKARIMFLAVNLKTVYNLLKAK
jgi:hypothetical protein